MSTKESKESMKRKLDLPDNWNKMSFKDQWVWILDKQREIEKKVKRL